MHFYIVFTVFITFLIDLLPSIDDGVLAPLIGATECDTTHSICYIFTPPSVLTIDPSPPVLAPPFNPDYAPSPPYTFAGATSAGYGANSFAVDWEANLVTVILIAFLVQKAVDGIFSYIGDGASDEVLPAIEDHLPSSAPSTLPSFSTIPSFPSFPYFSAPPPPPPQPSTDDHSHRSPLVSPLFAALFAPLVDSPNEDSGRDILTSCDTYAAAAPTYGLVSESTGDTAGIPSASSMASLDSSSSISDEDDDGEAVNTSNVSSGSMSFTAARFVGNFLDELTDILPPSPPLAIRTPPAVLTIPRDLWEDLARACYPEETPRTPADLDEVIDGHDEGAENGVIEPPVVARTIDAAADEPPAATSASSAQDVRTVESTAESTGPSREASSRIPRLAPTSVWKKSIDALVSGDRNKAARSIRSPNSTTLAVSNADIVAPASSSSAPSMDGKAGAIDRNRVPKAEDRVFEKCDCALESAFFEPESWNKFRIPASCHRRPPIHFLSPRDTDDRNPSTRIIVDNVNAFRYHSTEPNVPYTNKDVEDLFYGVGAKNVRCFDGRVVGGVVRYGTSYAVVDFETVGDAKAAFKMFQGRKAYSGGYHLRLKFVDVNDRTFGRRMAVSMGPMERSEEERRGFVEFVEDLDRVDVDLAKIALPSRSGFTLPVRPAAHES